VPLGLTSHRQNLPQLQPIDRSYSRKFISEWRPRTRSLKKSLGEPFLFLADEFYLKAGLPFPYLRDYGDLPQIENGVGMVPLFLREAARTLRSARRLGDFQTTVVTGVSSFPFVEEFLTQLGNKTGLRVIPVPVKNRLFGESVTVSGLVSGNDLLAALEGLNIGSALLVPDVMLKEGESVFLDDLSINDLEKRLGCSVMTFDSTPQGLYRALKQVRQAEPVISK
jgi:NifB/MoaA-like Fe-S oxidoreductase